MPRDDTSEMADALRTQAHDHPTVAQLNAQLASLPESGEAEEGLYVETRRTPGIVVNGELRVSVLRVMSVGPDGPRLVGQIQATREVDNPLTSWSLRLYAHEPEYFSTKRYGDAESWFIRLLNLHYEKTTAEPAMETQLVEA